ncbi:MAG: PH domain-containing protein [Eubacteriaceae bacterium]|nr:PH domain-containing protein [Eubacteriaceae bacterium]
MKNNRFRCHPSLIIENLGTLIVGIIAILVFNANDFVELFQEAGNAVDLKDTIIGVGILTLLCVVFTGYQVIIYLKTWISIENDTLLIERLTLRTIRRNFSIKNISNINLEQNVFERIIGTCKVKIDTNSQSTANETDIKIVLKLSDAKEFRNYILEQLDGESKNQRKQFEGAVESFDVAYAPGHIAMHCLYSMSLTVAAILIITLAGGTVWLGYVIEDGLTVKTLAPLLGGIITVLWFIGTCLYSLVRDFFRYYGFRAKRVEDRILLSYGLLRKRQYVLPVDKINSVKVKARLISRLCRRQSVEVICIGVGDEKSENSLLMLSERKDDILGRLALLLPEYIIEEPEIEMRRPCSLFSEIYPLIFMIVVEAIIVATTILYIIPELNLPAIASSLVAAAAAVLIVVYIVAIALRMKTEGIHVGDSTLVAVTGAFTRVVTWVPYRRIQSLAFHQGPFARHFGYAGGEISILAASASSTHSLPPLDEKLYRRIQEKIRE